MLFTFPLIQRDIAQLANGLVRIKTEQREADRQGDGNGFRFAQLFFHERTYFVEKRFHFAFRQFAKGEPIFRFLAGREDRVRLQGHFHGEFLRVEFMEIVKKGFGGLFYFRRYLAFDSIGNHALRAEAVEELLFAFLKIIDFIVSHLFRRKNLGESSGRRLIFLARSVSVLDSFDSGFVLGVSAGISQKRV